MTVPSRRPGTVLVVDDVASNLELVRRLLVKEGYNVVGASNGAAALDAVAHDAPDVVLLDVMMPGLTGFDVCRRLKQNPLTRLLPVVLLTGLQGRSDKLEGIEAGADDFLTKPFDRHELKARVQCLVELKRHTDELVSAESLLMSLALMVEARDGYTHDHCRRLAMYADALGRRLGLDEDERAVLHRGAFLHDIGKIAVPDAVLLKPGSLTHPEFEVMKRHTLVGDTLCRELGMLQPVRPIVRHHHELLDGSGYPDGLKGDGIPLLAQILGIVDVYDAVTTERPYKAALPAARACEELSDSGRRGFRRRDLIDEFIAMADNGDLGTTAVAHPAS